MSRRTESSTSTPKQNPYRVGDAVTGPDAFFGRDDVLAWVERNLSNPHNRALVLSGQPRIGKTSILLQLRDSLDPQVYHPIYFELRNKSMKPLSILLQDLAGCMAETVDFALPSLEHGETESEWFSNRFLHRFLKGIGEGRRVVFLLDEFDVLSHRQSKELPSDAAAVTFIPLLYPLTKNPRLAFVFVVVRQPEHLSSAGQVTLKATLAKEVWVLSDEAARSLIRTAERQGALVFDDKAVDRILQLTSCHPYLTQLLCYALWEKLRDGDPPSAPLVGVQDVNDAVSDALELGEYGLDWLWSGLSPAGKICATAIAGATPEGATIRDRQIGTILSTKAPRLATIRVNETCDALVKDRVLLSEEKVFDDRDSRKRAERHYSISAEMFRRWLARKTVDQVKGELDRIEPEADLAFKEAEGFVKSGELGSAIDRLRDALDLNRAHFGARKLLGEVYRKQGDLDRAIAELETAHNMDPFEAAEALGEALRERAQYLAEPSAMSDDERSRAGMIYRRLTDLQPDELRWSQTLADIELEATLSHQYEAGSRALQAGHWLEAQRSLAYVVSSRPNYRQGAQSAASLLARAVDMAPPDSVLSERTLAETDRQLAYELTAGQYGHGHSKTVAQCTIRRDGSGTWRREIQLEAFSVVSELNYYAKIPDGPVGSDVDYSGVRSLDPDREFVAEVVTDTKDSVEIRNRINPALLPGQTLRYEGVDAFSGLYAMPGDDLSSRLMSFDYYARDIMVPTRQLVMEVVFPYNVEPINPSVRVWYAVGMSMVPHRSEERRTAKLLTKRRLGDQFVISLEIEYPILGLTYVVSWLPELLKEHPPHQTE